MSLTTFLIRPVTVVHPGETVDRYGNTMPDWEHPTTADTDGWLAQTSGSEDHDRRDASLSGWSLYVPADVALASTDRVVIDTTTYELDGPPVDAWTPRGPHHLEATLRLVAG